MRGEAAEDYLKAIYNLSVEGDAGPGGATTLSRVGTVDLARHMGLSAASVTRMLQRLASDGLVEYEPYRGVVLTPSGEKVALEVIRHHRLLELYLHDVLGYSWEGVHAEADRLEHYISEELESRIFEALGRPSSDPHGEVIPTLEGEMPEDLAAQLAARRSLLEAPPGSTVVVAQVPADEPEKLRYLRELGIVPGALVEVIEQLPFDGGARLRVEQSGEVVMGTGLATHIKVVPREVARG